MSQRQPWQLSVNEIPGQRVGSRKWPSRWAVDLEDFRVKPDHPGHFTRLRDGFADFHSAKVWADQRAAEMRRDPQWAYNDSLDGLGGSSAAWEGARFFNLKTSTMDLWFYPLEDLKSSVRGLEIYIKDTGRPSKAVLKTHSFAELRSSAWRRVAAPPSNVLAKFEDHDLFTGLKGGSGMAGAHKGTADSVAARELKLYIENESALYPQVKSIQANLAAKKKAGKYSHALAPKTWAYVVEAGAKKYAAEFGGQWNTMFTPATRKAAAQSMADAFRDQMNAEGVEGFLRSRGMRGGHAPLQVALGCGLGAPSEWHNVNTFFTESWDGLNSWSDLRPQRSYRAEVPVLVPDLLSFSDYSGSDIERANVKVWRQEFASDEGTAWVEVTGAHGAEAIAVNPDAITDEMRATLDALTDYPLISDEAAGEVETELFDEAWESWGRRDFKRYIEKEYTVDLDDVPEESLDEMFHEGADHLNINGGPGYQIETGGGVHIYLEPWGKGRAIQYVNKWLDQWREEGIKIDEDDDSDEGGGVNGGLAGLGRAFMNGLSWKT